MIDWLLGVLRSTTRSRSSSSSGLAIVLGKLKLGELHAWRRDRDAAGWRCRRPARAAGLRRGQAGVLSAVPVLDRVQDRTAVLSRTQERRPAAGGAFGDRRDDRADCRLRRQPAVRVRRGHGRRRHRRRAHRVRDDRDGERCHRTAGPAGGPGQRDDQSHSRVVRRHLSDRRGGRGLVPGAARAAPDGRRTSRRSAGGSNRRCRALANPGRSHAGTSNAAPTTVQPGSSLDRAADA